MNAVLWTLQVLLALLFLFAGGMKLVLPIADMTRDIALPGAFLRVIGIAEVLGALGLVLPGLTGIRPHLTPLAAAGLIVIMIGATVLSFAVTGVAGALVPLATGLCLAVVAWGRRPGTRPASQRTARTA